MMNKKLHQNKSFKAQFLSFTFYVYNFFFLLRVILLLQLQVQMEVKQQHLDNQPQKNAEGFKKKDLKLKLAQTIYVCECGKNFLSFPAIYSHGRSKHGVKFRSKISIGDFKRTIQDRQQKIFFKVRKNTPEIDEQSKQFPITNNQKIMNSGTNYKFISKVKKIINEDNLTNIYGVGAEYLNYCSENPMGHTLNQISDTLYLFTQCINSHYMLYDQNKIYQNYCQESTAKTVPSFLNFFIIWYLPSNANNHQKILKRIKKQTIYQILDHFCKWLCKKQYTKIQCTINTEFIETEKESQNILVKKEKKN